MTPPDRAQQLGDQIRRAFAIADADVVRLIECEGVPVTHAGLRHYDVRPLLDERESAPQIIDMNRECLQYALERGLALRAPDVPHYLRLSCRAGKA
jgi:hypothetical protein